MDLKSGSKGQEVTTWQLFLISRKIDIKPDGHFGPKTIAATELWQQRANLPITGVVDDATYAMAAQFGFTPIITEKKSTNPPKSTLTLFSQEDYDKVQVINESRLAKVAPVVADRVRKFIQAAKDDGVTLQVVQGLRTFKEQDALFAQGRTRKGAIVTNARGGQSMHNYGLAVDLAPVVNGKVSWDESLYRPYNKWDDVAGLDWGGNWKKFKDLPHVQDTEGMNLAKVQQLYKEGGLALVWSKIK